MLGTILKGCGLLFVALVVYGGVKTAIERSEARSHADEGMQVASLEAERLTSPPAEPDECGATLAEFKRLQTGLNYRDAVRIIGCEGTEISRVDVGDYTTVMYSWEGTGVFIGNMNVTFQKGRLVGKAQLGLK